MVLRLNIKRNDIYLNENVNGDNTYEQQRRARADSILLMADIKISQIYIT